MILEDILSDGRLRRIPLAAICAATSVAFVYVSTGYVVSVLALKELNKVSMGGKIDKLVVMKDALDSDVLRAKGHAAQWVERAGREGNPAIAISAQCQLSAVMALRAACMFAVTGEQSHYVEALGYLDEVPSVEGAAGKAETLFEVISSDGMFAVQE